jgi:L-2,4-diaminobutyrate transaminase
MWRSWCRTLIKWARSAWTNSAHPICAAAGVANLRLIDELNLVENADSVGAYFLGALKDAIGSHRHVGDVRGKGLMAAFEFVDNRDDHKFFDPSLKIGAQVPIALLENGVIARAMPEGDILGFAPPLCLTRKEADKVVDATAKAVATVWSRSIV